MTKLSLILVFFCFSLSVSAQKVNHVILLNGGNDIYSNNPRYYESIKAMYEAFRTNMTPKDKITVLYGSGQVEDTYDPGQRGQHGSVGEATPTTKQPVVSPKSSFNLDYLFNGDKREIDGAATVFKIKQKFQELQKTLKPGEDITLFITDHGTRNDQEDQTTVNLWGEKISTSELGDLLREFPSTSKIRIVTNICFGGGLNDLTSKNLCVYANQQPGLPSVSESLDLDLYGQNFAFAIKNKVDYDKDGKPTYMDAHLYAVSLDNPGNMPMNSLEWFLNKNRNKILDAQKEKGKPKNHQMTCEIPADKSFDNISSLITDFDKLKVKIQVDDSNIPKSRQKLMDGRLAKQIQMLRNNNLSETIENLEIQIQALKRILSDFAKTWDKLSETEKQTTRQKAISDGKELKEKIAELENGKKISEALNLELNLLRYGSDDLVEEYKNIKGCLEYAY